MDILFAVWILDFADRTMFCVAVSLNSANNMQVSGYYVAARDFTAGS